mgnify:CR=1 FL=1
MALLKACAKNKDVYKGAQIHAEILQKGLLGKNPYLASSLVSMYAKCGEMKKAQAVFHMLPSRDVVSWNSLISGYAHHGGSFEEAFEAYKRMRIDGIPPNMHLEGMWKHRSYQ